MFLSIPARAGLACHDFSQLSFSVTVCDDNERVGRDALACVRSYRSRIQKAQAEVSARLQKLVDQMKNQQSDSYDRTQAGYQDARRRLEALIAEGKTARAAVDDLLGNIVYPEDFDEPAVTGMSPAAYLASQNCFAIPERVLHQSQAMLDKMMSDLAATEEAMLGKQNSAGASSAAVQVVEESNHGVRTTNGQGSGTVPGGKSRQPASDITGTQPPGSDAAP